MSNVKKIILNTEEKTVVCDAYKQTIKSMDFPESELQLENKLIEILVNQGYQYIDIHNEKGLKQNLKRQLEKLNQVRDINFSFTDLEWERFYRTNFEGADKEGVENKNRIIQGNKHIVSFRRDDDTLINVAILDKKNPQYNSLQVIRQYVDSESRTRYDVTILVNGLPLVQIELKRRGENIIEAFEQIHRYQQRGFHRLFEFIQIFVISNGTDTRYYSNTTVFSEQNKKSFWATSRWSDEKNNLVKDLITFAYTFLSKQILLDVITKYCVLDSRNTLKILRPYQIYAIEKIIERIKLSINNQLEDNKKGGYIWHTTGSGKTLTSFKAVQLANQIHGIDKVLFIVDRQDLDSQTSQEYKNFLGKDNDQDLYTTSNTSELIRLLKSDQKNQIIPTTIQKLNLAINERKISEFPEITNKRVVFIMDECHRTQTAETHYRIKQCFKKSIFFGFTGTPLFKKWTDLTREEKAETGKTDEEIESEKKVENSVVDFSALRFGPCLHKYQIINAINDKNVLPFWVDYVGDKIQNEEFKYANNEKRIPIVVDYIIKNFVYKTTPNATQSVETLYKKDKRFNSIFATSSIKDAILCYKEFKRQLAIENNNPLDLKVAAIFSESTETQVSEEDEDTSSFFKSEGKLKPIIEDFAKTFEISKTNLEFPEYRAQVTEKFKEGKINILIVVDMFLTGFDCKTLNTLWVDKHLEQHHLIQAFSRTNRIFDETKPHGNIVCFRNLKEEVDFAITLFSGDPNIVCIAGFEKRMQAYLELENKLLNEFPPDRELITEQEKLDFIDTYQKLISLANGLCSDERFYQQRKMSEKEGQDLRSRFLEIHEEFTKREKFDEADPSVQQTNIAFNLEILRSEEINVDYIFKLLENFRKDPSQKNEDEILGIASSLYEYREDVPWMKDWMEKTKNKEIDQKYLDYKMDLFYSDLEDFCKRENLKWDPLKKFVDDFRKKKDIYFSGSKIQSQILPPIKLDQIDEHIKKWSKVKDYVSSSFKRYNIFGKRV